MILSWKYSMQAMGSLANLGDLLQDADVLSCPDQWALRDECLSACATERRFWAFLRHRTLVEELFEPELLELPKLHSSHIMRVRASCIYIYTIYTIYGGGLRNDLPKFRGLAKPGGLWASDTVNGHGK